MADTDSLTPEAFAQLQELALLQREIIDHLPMMMVLYEVLSRTEFRVAMANRKIMETPQNRDRDMVGKLVSDLLAPQDAARVTQQLQDSVDFRDRIDIEEPFTLRTGDIIWAQTTHIPLANEHGEITRILLIIQDITVRKKQELAYQANQARLLEQQAEQLTELSTPLLTISDSTVVMPLIGSIDNQRIQNIMEVLLTGIVAHQASIVIVDITGVAVVDTQVANALIRASRAVQLLGAQVVLTGIRAEVAQTVVGLGVDLSSIITYGTLRDGIAYALRQNVKRDA